MKYREKYLIPDEFWKIVAMVKKDGALSVTAYIQSQQDYLSELEEFVYGPYQTYQVPVALIEELTGLDFGELYKSDPMEAYESTGLLISELTNIIL
jgi:endonuclease G